MNQEVITLAPGGQPIAQSLGFEAASVIADNLTSSYLSLPDAGKTVPPWVYGAVVNLPPGLRTARAKLVATVPAVVGPPVPLSQATLTWLDVLLPADSGHLLAQSTFSFQTSLGQLTQVAGGAAVNLTKQAVPPGTQSIGFVVEGNVFPTSIIIQGDQTLFGYTSTVFPNAGPYWFPWDGKDTTVSFQMTPTAINACTVDFLASPVVQLNGNPNAVFAGLPALWQTPALSAVFNGDAFGAGVTVHKVPGTAGQSIYVYDYRLVFDAANVCQALLQDTSPSRIDSGFCNAAGAIALQGNAGGRKMTSGAGLDLVQQSGAAAGNIWGHIHYNQGSP